MTTWVKGQTQPKPPTTTKIVSAPCPNCFQAGHLNFQQTDGTTSKKKCPWCSGVGWIPQLQKTK